MLGLCYGERRMGLLKTLGRENAPGRKKKTCQSGIRSGNESSCVGQYGQRRGFRTSCTRHDHLSLIAAARPEEPLPLLAPEYLAKSRPKWVERWVPEYRSERMWRMATVKMTLPSVTGASFPPRGYGVARFFYNMMEFQEWPHRAGLWHGCLLFVGVSVRLKSSDPRD